MSSADSIREFVKERLTAAAEEIFGVFAKTIVEYEEEIDRQRRLLDVVWKPEIKLHRIELPQQHVCEEEEEDLTDQQLDIQERNSSLDQEDPEPPQIKEEQELCTSQEGEQLVVKQETPTDEESDNSEAQTMCLNPDDTLIEAGTESAVIIPVISSVVSVATSEHQLLSGDQEEPKQQKRHYKTRSHMKNVSSCKLSEDNCNTDHGKKSFKCGKEFKLKSQLQRHKRTHTGEKPCVCNTCGKRFADSKKCRRHMITHTGKKPFTCKICGSAFRCSEHLKNHMRIHTGEKPFTCNICGNAFGRKETLKNHMRTHTVERPFTCKICGSAFSCSDTLKNHMRSHPGERPFPCKICGSAFRCGEHLKNHMRIHTGEKPFTCNICGNAFGRKEKLKDHMRTHTGERPYSCKICGRDFRLNQTLKKHLITHASEKPFKCKICGSAFRRNDHLKIHMKTHTG